MAARVSVSAPSGDAGLEASVYGQPSAHIIPRNIAKPRK
jgi:hypothetical protein